MSEHTPGPWTAEEYGNEDWPDLVIHSDADNRICFMATPGSHAGAEEIEANARLIASAPDMEAEIERLRTANCSLAVDRNAHFQRAERAVAERDHVRVLNAKLVAALQVARPYVELLEKHLDSANDEGAPTIREHGAMIRAALAKAGGKE
jgi:hypothetical protein